MSADLFAEFNALSDNGPSASATTQKHSQSQQQNQAQNQGIDWFSGHTASAQSAQWSSVQAQPQPPGIPGFSGFGAPPSQPSHSTAPVGGQGDEDDDGWGDFEVAAPSAGSNAKATPFPEPVDNWSQPSFNSSQPPRNRPVRASTLELMSNKLVDFDNPPQATTAAPPSRPDPKPRPAKKVVQSDPNVLFDVAEFELGEDDLEAGDDDDFGEFGDFESGAGVLTQSRPATVARVSQPPSMDLLSLDEPEPQPQPQRTRQAASSTPKQSSRVNANALSFGTFSSAQSPPSQSRSSYPKLAIATQVDPKTKTKSPQSATPVTAWPSAYDDKGQKKVKNIQSKVGNIKEDDGDWAAWDDFAKPQKEEDIDSTKPPGSWDWDSGDSGMPTAQSTGIPANDSDPPPINVPPPSILLSAFPDIINSAGAFLKPMAKQSASIKQQILANPKSVAFLRSYILLATTAARVIAGRKHRWHRDKILAKSMSISAAGSKGMKLAGVDKTQAVREDREAADVVAVWRENVGRVRSAVAAIKTVEGSDLKVPELSDSMPIHAAKMVPTSPKPCIICGLKREERIAKVDYDVEDSFGEWWVEYWGHRACKNFWIEHEQKLRQR
ncbi:hypothetical protein B0I35DRAFT_419477 [Stachybotrys elegans]|uniref:Serine/threonine-protein kinase ppk6 n=1 Tax=Stachybotrys elegans TaxID=80388 RepID=A0A8K0WWY1_9HYPO|nr:hypothetical protein B0I35DRAFT_419477 [Stachybotrys elegans]